jgi:hypothetical protein
MIRYAQGEIRFWLKSTKRLRLELEGPQGRKRGIYVDSTGGQWQEIIVPVREFDGVDLTRIFGLFLITSDNGPATFYFDNVRWSTGPTTNAPLEVRITGTGRVSPNYNGRLLEIGRTYTITATAGTGFVFTNWTQVLTNGETVILTNRPSLRFTMESNLVLVANFVDVQRPAVTITAPKPGQRWSNAVFTVRGTARDNGQVTNVWVQVGTAEFQAAQGSNGWANWWAEVDLAAGTNVVRAYAVDGAGRQSLTNAVSLFFSVRSPLILMTNGVGRITRTFKTSSLEVGRGYTVTAEPGAGHVFSNWTGGYISTNPVLRFIMQSNLVLTANFVTNPFIALQADYYGLFYPANDQNATNSGYIVLSLTKRGTFTGKLLLGRATLSFNGAFDLAGQARLQVPRTGATPLLMELAFVPGEQGVTGTITDGTWVAPLSSVRAAAANQAAGRYTLVIGGGDDSMSSPAGFGAGTIVVSNSGIALVTGKLADGSTLSHKTGVSAAGVWPLFIRPYGSNGLFVGWMRLDTNALALWIKPARPRDRYYANGFHEVRPVGVARYLAPAVGRNALDWTNGVVRIGGGNLPQPLVSQVLLTNNKLKVLGGTISNLVLGLSRSSGVITGSFVHPVTRVKTSFSGALIQDPSGFVQIPSAGWFLGTNQSGFVILEAARPALFGINFSPYMDGQDPNLGSQIPIEQLRQRMRIVQPEVDPDLQTTRRRN